MHTETKWNLYAPFDSFLSVDTWHTGHAYDEERFYTALGQTTRDPQFKPEQMGEYFRLKIGITRGHPLSAEIDKLVCKADAVWEFLRRTGEGV